MISVVYSMLIKFDLSQCLDQGDVEAVRAQLESKDVNEAFSFIRKRTRLHVACEFGKLEVARMLLQNMADSSLQDLVSLFKSLQFNSV